jgi:hypothetical protein
MEKSRLAAVLALVAFQASCNNTSTPDTGATGTVRAALTAIPADVTCIRIDVQGATRLTSQSFDVMSGMDATLLVTGVSTGPVVITAAAFPVACASVGMSTPTWVSDPVSAMVGASGVTDVSVVMHRNGQVNVGITFTDDTCNPMMGTCAATCSDMRKDGTETDVDCGGGACPRCADGRACSTATDCVSSICNNGLCGMGMGGATCTDMRKDGTETDVDCGGGACPQCANGKACSTAMDCVSSICNNGVCGMGMGGATCFDMRKDGTETDVDCGGGSCPLCANGQICLTDTDCASAFCSNGTCANVMGANCADMRRDGSETDVDCGGGVCPLCANGKKCLTDTDCASAFCSNGTCANVVALCSDMRKDGSETDVDCGGPDCPQCADGQTCSTPTDCVGGLCTNGICGSIDQKTCNDMRKNGSETDVDCGGGSCPLCADGKACLVAADCASNVCTNGICGPIETKMCTPVAMSTVAWWHADDNFSDSVGGGMGIALGNVTFAPGIHGDGFLFDGSPGSQVEGPAAGPVSLDTEMTIDAWINPTAAGGFGRIVDKIQPFGNDGYLLDLQGFQLRGMVGGLGVESTATVPIGVFTHVAMTYSPGLTLAIYINGMAVAVLPVGMNGIPVNMHPVMFGADNGGGSLYSGIIDEVRFWNTALNQSQIQQLVAQGPVCP